MTRSGGLRSLGVIPLALVEAAATAGCFLFLCGLAEHPPARRLVLELALIAPYAAALLWFSILKRLGKHDEARRRRGSGTGPLDRQVRLSGLRSL